MIFFFPASQPSNFTEIVGFDEQNNGLFQGLRSSRVTVGL